MKLHRSRFISLLAVALLAGPMVGCTSLRPLTGPSSVHVGQDVHVTTRAGAVLDFTVTAVEADALVGANVRVARDDVVTIESRQFDAARTTLVVAGAIVTAAIIVYGTIAYGYGEILDSATR